MVMEASERIYTAHRQTHEFYVEGCFGCRISTVRMNTSEGVRKTQQREDQLAKDRDAYKRLRRDGLQPNTVDGSANVEGRITDQVEIDFKAPIPKQELNRVKDIVAEVNMGQAGKDRAW